MSRTECVSDFYVTALLAVLVGLEILTCECATHSLLIHVEAGGTLEFRYSMRRSTEILVQK